MPSELVWVAAISSVIGAGGALLGAGISGLVTFHVTKRQTDAQVTVSNAQLRHNADESRRERLVAARRAYLDPLRRSLVQMITALIALQSELSTLQSRVAIGEPILEGLNEKISDSTAATQIAADELNDNLGQISDSTLVELINQAWQDQIDSAGEIQRITDGATALRGLLISGSIQVEAAQQELKEWSAQMKESIDRRQNHYLLTSKRVEDLLAGDDVT